MNAPAAVEPAAPVDDAAFAAAMAALGPFEPLPRLAIAVSGGRDSLALAALAAVWLEARAGSGVALTVDHGLRAAAGAEAAWVAGAMRRLGFDHRVLRAAPPARASQAGARALRYALLEQAAADAGCLHLLVGHHAEDNGRTVAMRRRRAAGPGTAGMAAVRELDRVRLLRPLLGFPRAAVEATARALGSGWLDDPSNRDDRFERSRIAADEAADVTFRQTLEATACHWLTRHAERTAGAGLKLDAAAWDALPRAVAAEVLARAATSVGGIATRLPGRGRVEAAVRRLREGKAGLTLAGSRVVRTGDRLVVAAEEPARRRQEAAAATYPLVGAPFAAPHVVTDAELLIC